MIIKEIIDAACKTYVIYEALDKYADEMLYKITRARIYNQNADVFIDKLHIATNISLPLYNTFGRIENE